MNPEQTPDYRTGLKLLTNTDLAREAVRVFAGADDGAQVLVGAELDYRRALYGRIGGVR